MKFKQVQGLGLNHNPRMMSNPQNMWGPRLATFALAALAAASAVFWGLKWAGPGPQATPGSLVNAEIPAVDAQALARALGGGLVAANPQDPAPEVINAASRMALVGVIANAKSGGTALIAIDGKPAKPFRVGAKVEDGLYLQSVGPRKALFAPRPDAPSNLTLEIPLLPKK